MKPFFSIVLVNYNTGKYLEHAILSVINQDCKDFEFIVVDAGSNDNSLEIINKYKQNFAWWVSEPDRGQSDAFNKGFSHATGSIFTWLNADDLMLPGTLSCIKKYLQDNPACKWVAPCTVYFDLNNNIMKCNYSIDYPDFIIRHGSLGELSPSSFFHRELFEKVGGFVVDYHYNMDDDLWMKFVKLGYNYTRLRHWGWAYRIHDESKTANTVLGVRDKKIDAEFEVIFSNNKHRYSSWALKLQRLYKCIFNYPYTIYYTWKYKGKQISTLKSI